MENIQKLNKLEKLYYEHSINFDFSNDIFYFDNHDETLIAYLKSYLENEDYELKKLALYIILASSVTEKSLQYNIFKTVVLFNDPYLNERYLNYLKLLDKEDLENFLYILSTQLEDNELSFFIKILSADYNKTNITLMFFLLETYKLNKEDTVAIYRYLFQKEDKSIITTEDFYNNSKLLNDFVDSLNGKNIFGFSYQDLENDNSLLKKRLSKVGSVAYFFNEDTQQYQIWVRLSIVQSRAFESVVGIDFNAMIDFPKNLVLHFLFRTQYGDNPFNIDLYFNNISDLAFIKYVLKNKRINFIFVTEDFIPIKSFDFVFSGPVLYKLFNQAWISYHFKDFEWLRIKDALDKIEKGEYLLIDIPVSVYRKLHLDLSLFFNIFAHINKSKNTENYIRSLNPVFYSDEDLDRIPKESLEKLVRNYVVELDKAFPYMMLFLSNAEEGVIKYMSYLLKKDFTDDDIKSEVVKRIVFIAGYLNARNIIYYDHVKKIASYFKIELTEKFMNKLADSFYDAAKKEGEK